MEFTVVRFFRPAGIQAANLSRRNRRRKSVGPIANRPRFLPVVNNVHWIHVTSPPNYCSFIFRAKCANESASQQIELIVGIVDVTGYWLFDHNLFLSEIALTGSRTVLVLADG
jgi:hypothetical protein